MISKSYIIRSLIVLLANIIAGLGLACLRISSMGTDPFTSMCYNASMLFHLPLTIFMIAVHACILGVCFRQMKKMIGFGTIINMTIYGLSADYWKAVLLRFLPLKDSYKGYGEDMPLRICLLFIGLFMILFFLSFYLASNTGMSPYDGLAYVLEGKLPIPYKLCRIITDVVCAVLSFIMGVLNGNPWIVIGVTTVFMMFCTGPLFSFFRSKVADPLFERM